MLIPGVQAAKPQKVTLMVDDVPVAQVLQALGGIFTRKNKSGQDSVPLLGDIPWFGQLFRHDGKEDERRELVVFITPRLVSSE